MQPVKNYSFSPSILAIGIREFSEWCRESEIDEWTAMLRMVDGDHAAMTLLRFSLRWGEAEHVKEAGGWFYRTGDQLLQDAALTRSSLTRARETLRVRLGMQEKRQRVRLPGGDLLLKNVMHYRLEPVILRAAFDVYCLEPDARTVCKTHAQLLKMLSSQTPKADKSQKPADDISQMSDFDNSEMPTPDNSQMPDDGDSQMPPDDTYKDSYKESYQSPYQGSDKVSDHQGDERDLKHPERYELPDYLGGLFDELGTPNGKTASILQQCEQLGDKLAAEVAQRCGKARTWDYVLAALQKEAERPEVQVEIAGRAEAARRDAQYQAERSAGLTNDPVAPTFAGDLLPPAPPVLASPPLPPSPALAAWETAYTQMLLQFEKTKVELWLRQTRFLRCEGEVFVIGVGSEEARELFEGRLYRKMFQMVQDSYRQAVALSFEVMS